MDSNMAYKKYLDEQKKCLNRIIHLSNFPFRPFVEFPLSANET